MINAETGERLLQDPAPSSLPRRPSVRGALFAATTDGAGLFLSTSSSWSVASGASGGGFVTEPLESDSRRSSLSYSGGMPTPYSRACAPFVVVCTIAGGTLDRFCCHVVFRLSGDNNRIRGLNLWTTFCLTLSTFTVCALCSSCSREARAALTRRASPVFLGMLIVPAALDVLITALALLSLAFAPPALVGIVKSAVQLVTLSVVSRLLVKRPLSAHKWACLLAMLAGLAILGTSSALTRMKDFSTAGKGLLLAGTSGVLGAWRNLVEAAILAEEGFPSGALLLAESTVSAALVTMVGFVVFLTTSLLWDSDEDASLAHMLQTLRTPWVPPLLVMYLAAAYAKDAGKMWLIQQMSVLHEKSLTLLFPFGTWTVSLLFYYCYGWHASPILGQRWEMPYSLIELLGFLTILAGSAGFVMLSDKKSVLARWCARGQNDE